jgi:hypothetical protein
MKYWVFNEEQLSNALACFEARRVAAIDAAMKLALKGDFSALNRLEVDYLNLLVRIGEFAVRHADGTRYAWFDEGGRAHVGSGTIETHAPFVVDLVRGYTRDAKTALEWALLEKCRHCSGLLRRQPCRVCEGRWYVDDMDDHEIVYTNSDGVVIEEDRP